MKGALISFLMATIPILTLAQTSVSFVKYSFDTVMCEVYINAEYKIYSDGTYYMEKCAAVNSCVYDTGYYVMEKNSYMFYSNEPEKIEIQKIEESYIDTLHETVFVVYNNQMKPTICSEYLIINNHDTLMFDNAINTTYNSAAPIKTIQYYDGKDYCSSVYETTNCRNNKYSIVLNTTSICPRFRNVDHARFYLNGKKMIIGEGYIYDNSLHWKYMVIH